MNTYPPNVLLFLGPHAKFHNPRTILSESKVFEQIEEEQKKVNDALNRGPLHFVIKAQGQPIHFAQTDCDIYLKRNKMSYAGSQIFSNNY